VPKAALSLPWVACRPPYRNFFRLYCPRWSSSDDLPDRDLRIVRAFHLGTGHILAVGPSASPSLSSL